MQLARLSNGDKYVGDTADGKRHGHGVYYYDSGDKYTGNWEHGKQCGHGVYVYANGDRYVGNWAGGKHHGEGTYYFKSGKIFQGTYAARNSCAIRRNSAQVCDNISVLQVRIRIADGPWRLHVHERREAGRRVERLCIARSRHLLLCKWRPIRRQLAAGQEAWDRNLLFREWLQVPGGVQ